MKTYYHKISFTLELIISGLFILCYYLLTFSPTNDLWEIIHKSTFNQITNILCYLVPIIVSIAFTSQWLHYGTIENLLRRGTFTIIVLIPLFIVWGDWQFTFWLSCVHLLSSIISFYEADVENQEVKRFSSNPNPEYLWGLSPAQIILITFVLMIVFGTTLLMLPISTIKDVRLIDHLFMVTSATCVTGLATVNLAESYSYFGQIVLLLCIQVGGLGIMTLSSSLTIFLGKSLAVKERLVLQDILDVSSLEGLVGVIVDIIKTTIVIEIIGAVILTGVFIYSGESFGTALYYGIFHSVSAFCNAGLSVIPDGLEGYKTNVVMNFTITTLIILGGIGFWVLKDIRKNQDKILTPKKFFYALTLHSKIVISTTFFLVVIGTMVIFISDYMGILAQFNLTEKMMISYFQSVTSRTAGYNTINIGLMSSTSLLFIIILMTIGASPGSTGGGMKTTTFAIIVQSIRSTLLGKSTLEFFKRSIDSSLVLKSTALGIIFLMSISLATGAMLVFESDKEFLAVLFEVVSAISTTGLSMGITPYLSNAGKILIIIMMYVGRVGPLTLVLGLSNATSGQGISYPKEKVIIG
jgi:trk system potassium uptake protein TrkH